jgi:hypothetical protein
LGVLRYKRLANSPLNGRRDLMEINVPDWEQPAEGIRLMRLYETQLNPSWPLILILQLSADKFTEFENDPLAFEEKYRFKYFPTSPISWMSACAKPPYVKGVAQATNPAFWTVTILKGGVSKAACAAFPGE